MRSKLDDRSLSYMGWEIKQHLDLSKRYEFHKDRGSGYAAIFANDSRLSDRCIVVREGNGKYEFVGWSMLTPARAVKAAKKGEALLNE